MDIYELLSSELEKAKEENAYRQLYAIQNRDGKYVTYKNKKYINLSSNDYLGLGTDRELHDSFFDYLKDNKSIDLSGMGSTSSRLLTGNSGIYHDLENKISDLYSQIDPGSDRKSILVFNSGYHANIGIISSLLGKEDLILSDSLNHASIIDGSRLSGAKILVFRHRDYDHLDLLLSENREKYTKAMIISESVFSMDGDTAELKRLSDIRKKYNTLLYIDEAHATGVFGNTGLGVSEAQNSFDDINIIIGTFGKALASIGAYAAVNSVIKEYLVNKARTLLFTTALPPIIINWNLYNIRNIEKYKGKREKLKELAEELRNNLKKKGLQTKGESQIIPVIIGDNEKTVRISDKLQNNGFLIFPIRPPTVEPGTSRIRISLTANLNWDDIEKIPDIINKELSGFSRTL